MNQDNFKRMVPRPPSNYPRILVICSNPFTGERNNGMTMLNLFRGWPSQRLAQVYVESATVIPLDATVCTNYWKLTPASALRGLLGISSSGHVQLGAAVDLATAHKTLPAWRRAFAALAQWKHTKILAEPAREALMCCKSLLTPPLKSWVQAFQPQAVYSTLGSLHIMRLSLDIAKTFQLPIVPHFTDDWLAVIYKNCVGGSLLRKLANRSLREVLDRAPVRLVISKAMGDEYVRRYGGDYHAFVNCLEPERFDSRPQRASSGPVRLLYLGGLGLNRWHSLQMLGAALERLGGEGVQCELHIYTLPAAVKSLARILDRPPWIKVVGWVPNDQVPELIAEADVLVHVESFDKGSREYTRFSISTKIPEYLMSGRCVLGFGPEEVASMQHLRDSGGAVAVGRDEPELLYSKVSELVRNRQLRERLAQSARAFALEQHSAASQRARFLQRISDSVRFFAQGRLG